jgi:general stress protein YciG
MSENNQQGREQKSIRGFAAMDTEKQKEIARKGGRAAHEQGVAHQWSSQEAREAGKKGGQARGRKNNNDER